MEDIPVTQPKDLKAGEALVRVMCKCNGILH